MRAAAAAAAAATAAARMMSAIDEAVKCTPVRFVVSSAGVHAVRPHAHRALPQSARTLSTQCIRTRAARVCGFAPQVYTPLARRRRRRASERTPAHGMPRTAAGATPCAGVRSDAHVSTIAARRSLGAVPRLCMRARCQRVHTCEWTCLRAMRRAAPPPDWGSLPAAGGDTVMDGWRAFASQSPVLQHVADAVDTARHMPVLSLPHRTTPSPVPASGAAGEQR
ncbi:hypothetical protein EON68_04090, partial [archaeon]